MWQILNLRYKKLMIVETISEKKETISLRYKKMKYVLCICKETILLEYILIILFHYKYIERTSFYLFVEKKLKVYNRCMRFS